MDKVINRDKKSERFADKAAMLGLTLDEKVEYLNKMYEGIAKFETVRDYTIDSSDNDKKIALVDLAEDIISFEFPECDDYSANLMSSITLGVYSRNTNLCTVKLPKSCKKFEFRHNMWTSEIERLFVWDTTELKGSPNDYRLSKLEMIIIQSTTGGKPKIYKVAKNTL